MKTIIINTNKKDIIVAIGNVSHASVAQSFLVPIDKLPKDLRECFSEYRYNNGKFIKSQEVNPAQELEWQRVALNNANQAIAEYQVDMAIDELYSELRSSQHNEDEYFKLLGDRKLLIEYVQQEDFPECGRPVLSGLVMV